METTALFQQLCRNLSRFIPSNRSSACANSVATVSVGEERCRTFVETACSARGNEIRLTNAERIATQNAILKISAAFRGWRNALRQTLPARAGVFLIVAGTFLPIGFFLASRDLENHDAGTSRVSIKKVSAHILLRRVHVNNSFCRNEPFGGSLDHYLARLFVGLYYQ